MSQSTADPTGQLPAPSVAQVPLVPPTRAAEPEPAARERRIGLTPVSLFLTLLVAYVLIKVQLVLVLVVMALVFATIIERPVQLLERRRLPRGLSILAVYVAIIATLTVLSILVAPSIGDQARAFRAEAPDQLRELRTSWIASRNPLLNGPGQELLDHGIQLIETPAQTDIEVPREPVIGIAIGVGGGLVGALTVLIIAFYYLMEKTWLRRLVLAEMAPATRDRVDRIWDNVEGKVGDWLRGQLTLCLVIGLTATIGYGVLGVRFWPLLGLWAGITEIIPIVGPWLGGVPAVVIALTQGFNKALLVVVFIVLLQFLENAVLVPRIMRGAVGLTPLTVFVAILAGTQLLGIVGALLAIPVAAAVQVVLTDFLDARREAKQRTAGMLLPGWRWMRGPLAPIPLHPTPVDPTETAPTTAPGTSPAPAPPPAAGWTSDVLARASVPPPDE